MCLPRGVRSAESSVMQIACTALPFSNHRLLQMLATRGTGSSVLLQGVQRSKHKVQILGSAEVRISVCTCRLWLLRSLNPQPVSGWPWLVAKPQRGGLAASLPSLDLPRTPGWHALLRGFAALVRCQLCSHCVLSRGLCPVPIGHLWDAPQVTARYDTAMPVCRVGAGAAWVLPSVPFTCSAPPASDRSHAIRTLWLCTRTSEQAWYCCRTSARYLWPSGGWF